MKFFDAIKDFTSWKQFDVKELTAHGYMADLRILCLYLHNPEIEEISLQDVLKHLTEMRQMEWAENTFTRKCQAFKNFFEFYRKQGHKVLDPDLIPMPAKEYHIPRVAEESDYQKLVQSIPRDNNSRNVRNLAIINLLWDTGARNSEICDLNVSELDLKEMKSVIKTKKNKGRRPFREIFWTPPTNENLQRWLYMRDTLQTRKKQRVALKEPDALFFSLGAGKSGLRMNNSGVGELLRRNSNRAGIATMNAHSFRHHMGHDIVEKGGSNSDVSNILGHSNLESSYVYTMLTNKPLQERYKHFKRQSIENK